MLGSTLCYEASKFDNLEVFSTVRAEKLATCKSIFPNVKFHDWSSEKDFLELANLLMGFDYVINAVGVIRQKHEGNKKSISLLYSVNTTLPIYLNSLSKVLGFSYIQIGTDCVFSGLEGSYNEKSSHSPIDSYGLSKSLSESMLDNAFILRCSIVGLEIFDRRSLLSWFINLPYGLEVPGYVNHIWNGVSSKTFARIVFKMIQENMCTPMVQHLIPLDSVTKFELLNLFAHYFGRQDIRITEYKTPEDVNRTLCTLNQTFNSSLWNLLGQHEPQSIRIMIQDISKTRTR